MINNFLLKSFVFFTVFVIFCSFYNAGAFNNEGELLRAVESVRKIEAHAKSQKDFDNVVEEYRKILFKFQGRTFAPTLAVLHFKMADILFDTGKSQEALKELIRIAELYPGTPQSLMAIRRINRAMDSIDTPASENKLKSYIDNQIGYTFYYMNDWWFENKSIADSEVKLFLERKPGAPCAERKFSVMTSKTADITGPENFSKAIFNEMKKLPDIKSLKTLSFNTYIFGETKLFLRKSKAVTDKGAEILLQATAEVNGHILVLTMVDSFVNLNDAGKEFLAILGTLTKIQK